MTVTMNHNELNEMELNQVNGGFHFGDAYSEDEYKKYGVKHESNWFSKDKYTLPDGTVTDYNGVVKYMKKVGGQKKEAPDYDFSTQPRIL